MSILAPDILGRSIFRDSYGDASRTSKLRLGLSLQPNKTQLFFFIGRDPTYSAKKWRFWRFTNRQSAIPLPFKIALGDTSIFYYAKMFFSYAKTHYFQLIRLVPSS